jgi:hypothetical protein
MLDILDIFAAVLAMGHSESLRRRPVRRARVIAAESAQWASTT